jgi:hypothetical protein
LQGRPIGQFAELVPALLPEPPAEDLRRPDRQIQLTVTPSLAGSELTILMGVASLIERAFHKTTILILPPPQMGT